MSEKSKYANVHVRGMNLRLDKDVLDDMDTVELLGKLQDGDIFVFPTLCRMIFGEKQFERIKNALADHNGKTKVSDMSEFFVEALTAATEVQGKNSSDSPVPTDITKQS